MSEQTVFFDELQGLERLTDKAKKMIIDAFELARSGSQSQMLPEHIFMAMLKDRTGQVAGILLKLNVDLEATYSSLQNNFPDRKTVKVGELAPEFSEAAKNVVNQAFLIASKLNHVYVGTEHLLLALLGDNSLPFVAELTYLGVSYDKALQAMANTGGYAGAVNDKMSEARNPSDPSALEYFATDMNSLAQDGKYLPTVGRDSEIERLIHILSRKTKNNPILVGEAGVGKTAIVEGFVQRIVQQEVPGSFLTKKVLNLDIASIVAGSKVRGDVEERVLAIINSAISEGDKILFIDEIHMIIGAGASGSGPSDIANILKPYLTNSDLCVIGATTIDEYRRYFESDAALNRRFQPIFVEEINQEDAEVVLDQLRPVFEKFHNVKISNEAIEAAVKLSSKYIADRFLPDKAIDLIDEAAAKLRITREIEIEPQLSKLGERLTKLRQRKEAALDAGNIRQASKFRDQEEELNDLIVKTVEGTKEGRKGRKVTVDMITAIVSSWTRIPVSKDAINDKLDLPKLAERLSHKIVGQDYAIGTVVDAVKRSHLGFSDPSKPLASFVFLGPTGVGKTQLAKTLAAELFGSEELIVQIDMSEYMEPHSVSKLIGSPPGYVGYQDGGQLTERIRRNPYSVVLFDEIEKAHPDVLNLLLQVLNDGHLQDSQGRSVSFRNTIIVLTSNIGAEYIAKDQKLGFDVDNESRAPERDEAYEQMAERIGTEMKDYLRPELINRLDEIIIFRGLNQDDCLTISKNLVADLIARVGKNGIDLIVDHNVVKHINDAGYSAEYGGRNLKRKVQQLLETPLANFMLSTKRSKTKSKVTISVKFVKGKIVFSSR